MPGWPNGATFSHVWSFGRLAPLLDMPLYKRWRTLWDEDTSGASRPSGELEDYFWPIEFQARGSPHLHMMIWRKDAPTFSGCVDGYILLENRDFMVRKIKTAVDPAMKDTSASNFRHPCTIRTPAERLGSKDFDTLRSFSQKDAGSARLHGP